MRHQVVDKGGNVQRIGIQHQPANIGRRQKLKNSARNEYREKKEADSASSSLHGAEVSVRLLHVEAEFGDVAVNEFIIFSFKAQLACIFRGVP